MASTSCPRALTKLAGEVSKGVLHLECSKLLTFLSYVYNLLTFIVVIQNNSSIAFLLTKLCMCE